MDDFIVVHAVGDEGEQWKESGHGYVPQVLPAAPLSPSLPLSHSHTAPSSAQPPRSIHATERI